jgi:predicted AlkP superfamily pyrophosphatase or phosphodiesterase
MKAPQRLIILDIDGLRQDVFRSALEETPHLGRIFGHSAVHVDALSTAPSITFCAQTTIFTGLHPDGHGITGNQFFDRFGERNKGRPRFYAFDIGDTYAVDDAVRVFARPPGLISEVLPASIPTVYELAARYGKTAVVAHHMLARGAHWLHPSVIEIARLTKGGRTLGLAAEQYDRKMIERLLGYLMDRHLPDIITAYWMGIDHKSHHEGPGTQAQYLREVIDAQAGRLFAELERRIALENTLVVAVSDHGQIAVVEADRNALQMRFLFDRELGHVFAGLNMNPHDLPGEAPNSDAVVASNGGMAHVYLKNRTGAWRDAPRYNEDVLPVAQAFWEANETGRY